MAGLGTRFSNVAHLNPNYALPKPFIPVRNHPMVRWATGSLPFVSHPDNPKTQGRVKMSDMIFIILQPHDDKYDIGRKLRSIYSEDITVITLPSVTRGAAETALMARAHIDPDEELLISDSDHYFDGTILDTAITNRSSDVVGIIPVFKARNEGVAKWSYSLLAEDGKTIKHVAEKDPDLMNQGAHANIGAYYFSKARYFMDTTADCIAQNKRTGAQDKAEFYIAPIYEELIDEGHHIEAAILPEVWGLGTPSDLEHFLEKNSELAPKW